MRFTLYVKMYQTRDNIFSHSTLSCSVNAGIYIAERERLLGISASHSLVIYCTQYAHMKRQRIAHHSPAQQIFAVLFDELGCQFRKTNVASVKKDASELAALR